MNYYKKNENTLANFTSDGGDAPTSLYEYEGQDYRALQSATKDEHNSLLNNWIAPPKRERKQESYDIDGYYRKALNTGGPSKGYQPTKPPGMPTAYDFQFYPPKLHKILEEETKLWKEGLEAKSAHDKAVEQAAAIPEGEKKPDIPPYDAADYKLSEAVSKEREQLLEKGFGNWGRRDFQFFIRGMERYGRRAYDEIARLIGTKTQSEVRQYANVFWKKYKEIDGYKRHIAQVERGEAKIQRIADIEKLLSKKVGMYANPWKELEINYGSSKSAKGTFLPEEDQFLICLTNELGYGNWSDIKTEMRSAFQFKFDWWLKSRTPLEINRRVDILIRLIEKEMRPRKASLTKASEKERKPSSASTSQTSSTGRKRKNGDAKDDDDNAKRARNTSTSSTK